MKILFLKTRNPPDYAFIKIIQKIFEIEAFTDTSKSIMKRYRTAFSDYRYNFKKVLSPYKKFGYGIDTELIRFAQFRITIPYIL